MSSQPTEMRALVMEQFNQGKIHPDRPVPKPKSDEVLVKVSHVALNPCDWKHLDSMGNPNATLGCDFSGTVESVGDDCLTLKAGDKVCGMIHGGKLPERGSFAEYLVTKGECAMKIPSGMSDADAATFGVGYFTAAMAVFHAQGYKYPPAEQKDGWFLVSGGSTSVGLFVLSLLRQLGVKAIATASPRSFELVKSYGADHVVDYHNRDAALEEIKKVTGGGVVGGLECVGGDDNYFVAINSFVKEGGLLTTITEIPDGAGEIREEVKIGQFGIFTVCGYSFEMLPGLPWLPAIPEDKAWYIDFIKRSQGDSGFLSSTKPNPVELRPGDLDGIAEGMDLIRQDKVSGKKLVYQIA